MMSNSESQPTHKPQTVHIPPGTDLVQGVIDNHPACTHFILQAGEHHVHDTIRLRHGTTLEGAPGSRIVYIGEKSDWGALQYPLPSHWGQFHDS